MSASIAEVVNSAAQTAQACEESDEQARLSLDSIVVSADKMAQMSAEIAVATEEQTSVSTEVRRHQRGGRGNHSDCCGQSTGKSAVNSGI